MKREVVILIAEDDDGHAALIQKNLKRAGIINTINCFKDGEELMKYLYKDGKTLSLDVKYSYLFLLDIRMPKLDGVEVLKRIKSDPDLKKMPVIMVTTTDDPKEVASCHEYGCSSYITKPIDYEKFSEAIRQLGLFLMIIEIPEFVVMDRIE